MAATSVQGSHIGFYVRVYGVTTAFKKLVCEESVTFDLANSVTSTLTKCGYFKGVSVPDFKANGSAVHNFTPDSSEVSLNDVQGWQTGLTKLEYVIQNEAHDAINAGHEFKMAGVGWFVNSQGTANANDTLKFTWNFEGEGTPTLTESA